MLNWLVAGSVVYLLTAYIPSLFLVSHIGVWNYMGSRDLEPLANHMHGRAQRAARNSTENFPLFALFGVLSMVVDGANMELATLGAAIFVCARIVYVPLYLFSVPVVRSFCFLVGWIGMILMGWSLFG